MAAGSLEICPCGTQKPYQDCCQPLHEGQLPTNALELMRSRYSAYSLNLPDYIIKTTHPASPQYNENLQLWKREIIEFSQNTSFEKLEIIDFKEEGELALVAFTAYISHAGKDAAFTEASYFEKKGGKWLYLRGRTVAGSVPEIARQADWQFFPLAYYGDPVLTAPTEEITEITDEIKTLAQQMIAAMHSLGGIGLAAPQIKRSIKMFVAQPPIQNENGKFQPGPIEVFINPKLSMPSRETTEEEEGCLSIPTVRGKVRRPFEVTVEYTTLQRQTISRKVSGWEARVIMHENDHLEGTLFPDRLEKKERYALEPRLRQLKQRVQ